MKSPNSHFGLSRREFFTLLTGAGVALCAGCKSLDGGGGATVGKNKVVDAGLATNYATEGVYTTFLEEGFFVVRHRSRIIAISSICTHRNCLLDVEPDHSFSCHCHGSAFSPDGKVTNGPATRDLPILETSVNSNGHLLVNVIS